MSHTALEIIIQKLIPAMATNTVRETSDKSRREQAFEGQHRMISSENDVDIISPVGQNSTLDGVCGNGQLKHEHGAISVAETFLTIIHERAKGHMMYYFLLRDCFKILAEFLAITCMTQCKSLSMALSPIQDIIIVLDGECEVSTSAEVKGTVY